MAETDIRLDTFVIPSGVRTLDLMNAFEPRERRRQLDPPTRKSRGVTRDSGSGAFVEHTELRWLVSVTPGIANAVSVTSIGSTPEGEETFLSLVRRIYGPEGVKHLIGILIALSEHGPQGHFLFDTHTHLDALGYKRRTVRGHEYHRTENVQAARTIVRLLASLEIEQLVEKGETVERSWIRPFLLLGGTEVSRRADFSTDGPPDLQDVLEVEVESIAIAINPLLFDPKPDDDADEPRRCFTRQLRQLAREDARQHGITLLLGVLLPVKWRMKRGPIRLTVRSLLKLANLDPEGRDRAEHARALMAEFGYMKAKGYIGDWQDLDAESDKDILDHRIDLYPQEWLAQTFQKVAQAEEQNTAADQAERPEVDGAELRKVRQELGLKQDEMADRLGVSRSTVAMAEHGDRELPEDAQALFLGLMTGA